MGFEGNLFRKDSWLFKPSWSALLSQKDPEKFKASESSVAMGLASFIFLCQMKELGSANASCHCGRWGVSSCRTVSFGGRTLTGLTPLHAQFKKSQTFEAFLLLSFLLQVLGFCRQICLHKMMGYLLHLSSWGMNSTERICWACGASSVRDIYCQCCRVRGTPREM